VEFKAILVLSWCAGGQFENAVVILLDNKHTTVGRKLTFPEAVFDDLRRLRDKGLTDVDVERIEKLVRETGNTDAPPGGQQRAPGLPANPLGENRVSPPANPP
jgi:hypothetical protein